MGIIEAEQVTRQLPLPSFDLLVDAEHQLEGFAAELLGIKFGRRHFCPLYCYYHVKEMRNLLAGFEPRSIGKIV